MTVMSGRQEPVRVLAVVVGTCALALGPAQVRSAEPAMIPHGQMRAPGEPLSQSEAVRRMTVPEGFTVEVVASEPDIVNPVAMTFDERGRVWITESLEYPRSPAGPGRDRVKVLEDSDGDGKADRFSIFADGLNIPSGIAVGYGGVWVANAPDILFLRDTDGDGRADRREVVVTGFGRADTHELPNSLTWGPDGWLYGWNGVYNPSRVVHGGKTFEFTCALFRIHPRTRDFELFCEGTSNPWGVAWDSEGCAFASACVIDHLWHLTETGYYHRQGGPYPPFTWKIGSIVDHRHQQAAYCGIHFYDSDAYPARFRGTLFMGNIHGNCVNVDRLRRNGSTYAADPEPDFLAANDAWFMPVSQKTGPDGCLYVLDWYDRYHCYQDARRDPDGIDRLKGRLYRVRYNDTPRRSGFDLSKETDEQLISRLGRPNGYDRETARRLLAEREGKPTDDRLRSIALDTAAPRRTRMNALWTRVSRETSDLAFLDALMADPDPGFRAWGVRAAGNLRRIPPAVRDRLVALARDPSPDVQLQVAIAARKIEGTEPVALLAEVASACGDDPLIPNIVWQNLHPLLASKEHAAQFLGLITVDRLRESPALVAIAPRAVDRLVGAGWHPEVPYGKLILRLAEVGSTPASLAARDAIRGLAARVQNGEFSATDLTLLRAETLPILHPVLDRPPGDPLRLDLALLATSLKDPGGYDAARTAFASADQDAPSRIAALKALIAAGDQRVLDVVDHLLSDPAASPAAFRGQVLAALGRLDVPGLATLVITHYPRMEPELRPQAVELLTQRDVWRLPLVTAVRQARIPSSDLNANQIRRLLADKDPAFVRRVRAIWGTVREERNPGRERVIKEVRSFLRLAPGDPLAGTAVFKRVCAQCHKIYGEGQEVGPDITMNGRGSYEQLLSNVLDPSLVIGTAYQGTTVSSTDGRVLTGLLVERSPQRVVLKTQGGKLETVPGEQVEAVKVSPLSLMPEDLEKQLTPRELADLFAFLTLDKPPTDPVARPIPGAQEIPRGAPNP
jgi:putative membrane-bound dehydrogenase-like protein